ncbi:MAG: hypothetical protein AAFZ17_03115 [Cyanobacteria bacterium J06650_10]
MQHSRSGNYVAETELRRHSLHHQFNGEDCRTQYQLNNHSFSTQSLLKSHPKPEQSITKISSRTDLKIDINVVAVMTFARSRFWPYRAAQFPRAAA